MANFQEFSVTPGAAAQVTAQIFTVAVSIQEDDGTVIADFTGANALQWPTDLAALTEEQRLQLLQVVVNDFVLMRAGLS